MAKNKYTMINDSLCSKCRAPQSWRAKHDYIIGLVFSIIYSVLIIGCGSLVGLIFDNALANLARSVKIEFIKNLMNNGVLLGTLIGFICALIYFLRHIAKIQDQRYQAENVEKKEVPIIHFDQMKVEKKTFELLKEDRLK